MTDSESVVSSSNLEPGAMRGIACEMCNAPLKVKRQRFCSWKCIGDHTAKKIAEKTPIKYCLFCKEIIPYKPRTTNKKFCSHTCAAKHTNIGRARNSRYAWEEINREYHNNDLSIKQIKDKYGFSDTALLSAIKQGRFVRKIILRKIDRIDSILSGDAIPYNRGSIKKYIIKHKILDYKCSECGLGNDWQGKPLVLVLDHKNGIHNDNTLSNLRFLCPNCNSQMPTFSGRNKRYKSGVVVNQQTH